MLANSFPIYHKELAGCKLAESAYITKIPHIFSKMKNL